MNWKEIKKKYPNAFKMIMKNYDICFDSNQVFCPSFNLRDLYDLFDKAGMTLGIAPWYNDDGRKFILYSEFIEIESNIDIHPIFSDFTDRKKSEVALFERAFTLLEKELTSK